MAAPFQPLPPGVYFNPSAEECVRDYLRPWNAGVRPGTDRIIVDVNIYGDRPDALVRGRAPGFSRGFDYKWLLLTHCIRLRGGRGRAKARARRDVATGGNWKVEQKAKGVVAERADGEDDPPAGGRRRAHGFYLGGGRGKGKKDGGVKTPWLMEEITTEEDEADAAGGWRGERVVKVFCKLYVSPRASDEEKMEIFGEDGVPFDRNGKAKTLVVDLPADLFDAFAESVYGAQGPGSAPLPPRVLGHQQGQPAPPPLLRVQYAAPPRVVHAHQHGRGGAHPGFLGYQHGQGAPRQIQGGPGQYCAVEPQRRHVLDPYQTQEVSPGFAFAGYYNHQDEDLYQYSAPSFVRLDPQQDEEVIRMEKKPRLEYDSPGPRPQGGADSDRSSCVVQASTSQEQGVVIKLHDDDDDDDQCGDKDADAKVFQEPEHVAKTPQEIPGTATGPPELAHEACKVAAESMRDHDYGFIPVPDLVDFIPEPFVDAVPDILMCRTLNPPSGDEPPLQLGFDEFLVEDFMKDVPDF